VGKVLKLRLVRAPETRAVGYRRLGAAVRGQEKVRARTELEPAALVEEDKVRPRAQLLDVAGLLLLTFWVCSDVGLEAGPIVWTCCCLVGPSVL
jgi:hypothetical protein